MERLFTIGAYGFDAERFFAALEEAKVDLFLDLRRRRGVRGREYAFANAGRLMEELEAREIPYRHVLDLAPDNETRELQSRADKADRVARRKREALSDGFVADYTTRTLDPFDLEGLIAELKDVSRPTLFCVERTPQACHRGLVADRLANVAGVPVTHLVP